MKHIIIGTAGHVDHGKTALIKALTGTDTDRLKEEKARGISIDIGFAALTLSEDITAGIVDVPGHERFLKNMLAGTGGIDMALLVIAADEGIMPQTREHLAMLRLFGVSHGLVVINKIDKVDAEWLDLIEEEAGQLVKDTFLAGAPVCRVSAVTRQGLDDLRDVLLAVAEKVTGRDSLAPFRLWIDRTFSAKGYGTVVTGSVLSGNIGIGEGVQLYPGEHSLKVRGLEWHGQKVDRVFAGQRAAINLSGADTAMLARGMALSAASRGAQSSTWDIAGEWLQELTSGVRVRLHLGTGEFLGRLYRFKDMPPRFMRLILEEPLAAGLGDRGIVRLYSPQLLLGGATLIAPGKYSRKLGQSRMRLAEALAANDGAAMLYNIIEDNGQPTATEDIKRAAGYIRDDVAEDLLKRLVAGGSVLSTGGYYLTREMLGALTRTMADLVGRFHKEHPDRRGLSKEIVRQKLALKEKPGEVLLEYWQGQGDIVVVGGEVALRDFAARHSDWRQNLAQAAEAALEDIGLTSVDWQLLGQRLNLPPDKARTAQENLVRQGLLVRIGEMCVYRKTIQYIAKVIQRHFAENSTLTVAELRDLLATSRKVAVPLMEYLDLHKYTVREGDVRRQGPKLQDLSE